MSISFAVDRPFKQEDLVALVAERESKITSLDAVITCTDAIRGRDFDRYRADLEVYNAAVRRFYQVVEQPTSLPPTAEPGEWPVVWLRVQTNLAGVERLDRLEGGAPGDRTRSTWSACFEGDKWLVQMPAADEPRAAIDSHYPLPPAMQALGLAGPLGRLGA